MIFYPPQNIALRNRNFKSIFLAGSIEMGKAEDWQKTLGDWLLEKKFNVFNPRRKDWDSTWTQTYENPNFSQQVKWELNALDKADLIIMYLDPNTQSPISLMELGLFAHTKKLLVVCPDGFWRKGNVEVVCSLYDIPLFNSLDDLKKYAF
jgi:nucleoside 2-deoxyribosyltransferase